MNMKRILKHRSEQPIKRNRNELKFDKHEYENNVTRKLKCSVRNKEVSIARIKARQIDFWR